MSVRMHTCSDVLKISHTSRTAKIASRLSFPPHVRRERPYVPVVSWLVPADSKNSVSSCSKGKASSLILLSTPSMRGNKAVEFE